MKFAFWLFLSYALFTFSQKKDYFHYGTQSSEALTHYQKGWEHILDRGEWTLAEVSFRKAVQLDSGFVLAWSQVGRISKNPEERALIFQHLSAEKVKLSGWEKKLLEVYLGSLELIDSKDRGLTITPDQVRDFYKLSEKNFSDFLKVYPNEPYVNSEFIEVIHGIYGSEAALDSLQKQVLTCKKLNPFLISYQSQMQAEVKDFKNAFRTAFELDNILDNSNLPIIPFTFAFIHFEKEEYEEAEKFLDQTLKLDENHTLAQRMKKQVDEKKEGLER